MNSVKVKSVTEMDDEEFGTFIDTHSEEEVEAKVNENCPYND